MQNKIVSVVFVSNFFNDHQKPLSDAMYKRLGDDYRFIETSDISEARKQMGIKMPCIPSYVVTHQEYTHNQTKYQNIIDQADVVIYGSAPYALVKNRICENKLTFRYSERPLKKGLEIWKYPIRFIRWRNWYPNRRNVFLLCSSAYSSGDYAKFGVFRNRCYKWGYFPETREYIDIHAQIGGKRPQSLLWVARFLELKHPEAAIDVAKRLKAEGYHFELNMIGNGELESEIRNRITTEDLADCVHMLGSMQPEQVREHMERSEIFLFTSDRNEGWGAVLNESMNSACAVVASHAIGSVPFLIEDGINGLIYKDGNIDDLYQKVKWLLDHPQVCKTLGRKAYETVTGLWNAETAAERLLNLSQALIYGQKHPQLYESGPCSIAEIMKD